MRFAEEMPSDNEIFAGDVMDFGTVENIVISLEAGFAFFLQIF